MGLMPRLTIELSADDLAYLEAELADGRGRTLDDLLAQAVHEYRRARGAKELDRLVEEAIDSGEPIEITPDYWERKKQEFLARRQARVQ
jgi:antitoxin ParD1/3/4